MFVININDKHIVYGCCIMDLLLSTFAVINYLHIDPYPQNFSREDKLAS